MNKRWLLIPLLVVAFSAFVGPGVFASGPVEGRTGRAEVRFLEGMIDHHQMALDMANDCLAKAETATMLTLCQNVINTQSAEIEQMRQWLLEWYAITYTPMAMGDHMNMMGMMQMMQDMTMQDMMNMMGNADMSTMTMQDMMSENTGGMDMGNTPNMDMPMMMGMMAGLSNLEGVEYEIAWLEAMIDHHDDALHMSERILKLEGIHAETAEIAQNIITAQTEEIALMEGMITELSAE